MTTTVTMNTAVYGPAGLMAAGSTQALADDFAAELIHSKRATRVTPQDTGPAFVTATEQAGGGIAVQVGGRGVPLATTNARRLVIDGDSIGAQGWTSNATSLKYSNHGWWVHALAQKGWPLKVVAVSAVPSETSSQILARFASSVAAYGPAEVWAIIGQNNLGDGDGGAQCLADIRAYAEACRNIGARLRLGTVTPRTTAAMTATIKTNILRINAGIVAMAREGLFSVFDSYSALVDPASADGASRSGVQIDTVHPNALGAYWIGREFALSQTDLPSVYSSPIGNLDTRLTNAASARLPANPKCSGSGGTVGTGGSGTAAASWSLNRQSGSALTVAGAVETDSADPGTTWQRMTFGGTVASGVEIVRFQQSVSLSSLAAAIVPGVTKIIGARCRVKSSSLPASLQYVRMTIETLNAVPAVTYTANGMADSSYQLGVFPSAEQVIECPPDFVIPADTTSVRITLNVAFGVGAASGDLWVTDIDVLTDAM